MRRDDRSPRAYRADVDVPQREILERVRHVIWEVHPTAKEGIAHGMLDYPGLASLAAQTGYVSLYVAPAVLAKHAICSPASRPARAACASSASSRPIPPRSASCSAP